MNTRTRTWTVGIVAGATATALLLPVAGAQAGHRAALVSADLDGRSEVAQSEDRRMVGDPNGDGEAYLFSPEPGELCYVLEVDRIEAATAAHVHEAPAGENGDVVVTLGAPTDGEAAGCVDGVDDELIADILVRETSDYYVNVHNEEYPGGALRGQLG